MEPISGVASILALIEAAVAVAKGIENLRAIKQLPKDFASLLEEVKDLQHQLEQCRDALDSGGKHQAGARIHGSKFLDLGRTAKDKLDQLANELPASCFQDGPGPLRKLQVYWMGMVDGKSRLRRCRDELRDVRLGLVQAIASLTALVQPLPFACNRRPVVVGIDAKVDEIVGAQRDIQTAQREILNTVIAISHHARAAGLQRPPSYESTITQTTTISASWDNMTRKKPSRGVVGQGTGILDVRIPPDRFARFCLPWCSCQCHTPTYMNSYDALRDIFGCLRITHSGVPGLAKVCNENQCRRRMSPRVTMRYRLPRAIASFQYLTCSFSTLAGIELRVKLPRVVDWTAPVWHHATVGNFAAVANLFRNGLASPWDVTPAGGNLLHYATDHWNSNLCKLLLDADLDCEAEDDWKNTAVAIAWERVLSGQMTSSDATTVATLFEDVDYLSSRSFTLIHKTVLGLIAKDLDLELSYSTSQINLQDSRGRTPLVWASVRGDEHAVRTLLRHGADHAIADDQGHTPLHLARNTACAEALLEKGADVHARNNEGRTVLFMACRLVQSASLTRLLLDAGARVDEADLSGETALHNTVTGSYMPFVGVLLERGADVNSRNSSGDTPLVFAVMYNRHDMLRGILRERGEGADFGNVNEYGHSFAHVIARTADVETVGIIMKAAPGSLKPDLAMRDREGKTAEEYFMERVEVMEEDEEGELREAFGELIATLNGEEVPAKVARDVEEVGEKVEISLRVTEVLDEEPGMGGEVFHDAVETF